MCPYIRLLPGFILSFLTVVIWLVSATICSGSLINNLAGEQFLLTATHCIDTLVNIEKDLKFANFIFNAESFSCEDDNGPDISALQVFDL